MRETRDLKGLYILKKEVMQNKMKKADNPVLKDGQDLNRHFVKEAVQMATNMKRYSISLVIRRYKLQPPTDITPQVPEWL